MGPSQHAKQNHDFKIWGGCSKAAADRRVGDFNAQELANIAWAFALVGQPDALLFTALARKAECRMGDFNAQ